MAKDDEHSGRKIALGAFFGAIAGFVTGILTAPKSGKETRADIAEKVSEVKQEGVEQLQNLHDELDELVQSAKDKTLALSAKAREQFNEAMIKAKDARAKAAT